MMYSKMLNINENFQYSINLQFDINNINKVKEYIPTKDSCEVMRSYLNGMYKNSSRATTLIGPYGKGKSHLLLILLTLLNDYEKEDINIIDNLINRIKATDIELYEDLVKIRKNKTKLLPIIINSNYNDLNQAFLIAMSEALEREKIHDIVVDTYFDIALKVIEKWEDDGYKEPIEKFNICLAENNTTLKDLKDKLKMYSEEGYKLFKNVYSCVLHGTEFNPLINQDIVKYYKDINYKLCKKGYNGMFIVFDEFSKFLEYVGNDNMMRDLKMLQDIAEWCSRTGKEEQLYLTCITHKTINEYIKNLKDDKINAFKTVEGRFKEIYFNRSMEQNYEIIAQTINKNDKFSQEFDKIRQQFSNVYDNILEIGCFSKIDNVEKILIEGCFPLNPLTTYSVIMLSEKIAQNERTLFTFLTDDDKNSLKAFINNNRNDLFNVDKIYDYFLILFRKENSMDIRDIWIKSEGAIKKVIEENEEKILKSLAIIYMINDFENISPIDKILKVATNLSDEKFEQAIKNLLEKGIIKKRKITNEYDFSNVYNKEIVRDIENISNTKLKNIDLKNVLNKIVNLGYVIPRKYNEKYKMTRFFKNVFITEEELENVKSFKILFNEIYTDGILLNLIKTSDNVETAIENFKSLKNDKTILKVVKNKLSNDVLQMLREYEAIQIIKRNNDYGDELSVELEIIEKELIEGINSQIEEMFDSVNVKEYYYKENKICDFKNLSTIVSNVCEEIYYKTPIVNNEMINKQDLTAPTSKARNTVIECVLMNSKDNISSPTSQEATIYKAIVEKIGKERSVDNIIKFIKDFITKSEKNKLSFGELYGKLQEKPYGIRLGLMPILIAISLYELSDNIVLYYQNREIDIDSVNLSKINDNPDSYYIMLEKGTIEKQKYITDLLNIFNVKTTNNLRINIRNLMLSMKKWILSLPRVVRDIKLEDNNILINPKFVEFKNELLKPDINNNQFIYERLIAIFKTDNYKNIVMEIKELKNIFDTYINLLSNKLIIDTIKVFDIYHKGTIVTLLKEWYKKEVIEKKNLIHSIEAKQFINYIKDLNNHNEIEVIETIAYILTGLYIEDWQCETIEKYFETIKNIKNEITNTKNVAYSEKKKIIIMDGHSEFEKYIEHEDVSSLGGTLKNNLEDIINEYGESISESEKVKILLDIIKKYV